MPALGPKRFKELTASLRVKPGATVTLHDDFDPGHTGGLGKEGGKRAVQALKDGVALLTEYQDRLQAQQTHAVLVVLQGLDGAGKELRVPEERLD